MGAELNSFFEVKFIIHSDEGTVRVVTHPAHILRRRINQPRLPGIGRSKCWILEVHHRADERAAMPMAGLTSDAGHLGGHL